MKTNKERREGSLPLSHAAEAGGVCLASLRPIWKHLMEKISNFIEADQKGTSTAAYKKGRRGMRRFQWNAGNVLLLLLPWPQISNIIVWILYAHKRASARSAKTTRGTVIVYASTILKHDTAEILIMSCVRYLLLFLWSLKLIREIHCQLDVGHKQHQLCLNGGKMFVYQHQYVHKKQMFFVFLPKLHLPFQIITSDHDAAANRTLFHLKFYLVNLSTSVHSLLLHLYFIALPGVLILFAHNLLFILAFYFARLRLNPGPFTCKSCTALLNPSSS